MFFKLFISNESTLTKLRSTCTSSSSPLVEMYTAFYPMGAAMKAMLLLHVNKHRKASERCCKHANHCQNKMNKPKRFAEHTARVQLVFFDCPNRARFCGAFTRFLMHRDRDLGRRCGEQSRR